jgi:hypothetical protein
MRPAWLIEAGIYRDAAESLKREVERQGMVCAQVQYRTGKKPPEDILGCPPIPDDGSVVFWGTLPLMRQIQLYHRWTPGGWCSPTHLDCAVYYAYFGPFLLNHYYTILPGVEAARLVDRLFDDFGRAGAVFVRPSSVHKLFTGTLASYEEFRNATAPSRYDPASLVVVSEPRTIGREWRIVVADGVPVASSQYRNGDNVEIVSGCPERVTDFVVDMLRRVYWRPEPVFVMDVCESQGALYLIELNSFSCSGLYACDLAATVDAVSRVATREWEATQATGQNN